MYVYERTTKRDGNRKSGNEYIINYYYICMLHNLLWFLTYDMLQKDKLHNKVENFVRVCHSPSIKEKRIISD